MPDMLANRAPGECGMRGALRAVRQTVRGAGNEPSGAPRATRVHPSRTVPRATRRLTNVPTLHTMADDSNDDEPSVNNVVFPRKLLKKFIGLYKELPCLWDRTCAAYKQKHKRHEAITRLTKLVQEHDPTATRVHVLRKIESLRACVRREHKRVRDSRRTANSPDQIYKPHLWYYDLFSFVFTEDGCYNFVYPMKADGKVERRPESEEEEDQPVYEEQTEFEQSLDPSDYALASSMVEVTESNKHYSGFDDDPKAKRHCTEVEDEYDAIGINVAAKLRNLPHNMRILAEKLINDVLFQAQLNGLNASTVISTTDPFKQDPL